MLDLTWLKELLQYAIYVLILTVVPVLVKHFNDYLDSKKEALTTSSNATVFENTLKDVIGNIQKAVDETSQTYVNSLKNSGNFNDEAQKEALNRSLKKAMGLISSDSKALLISVYGDLEVWVKMQIESYILGKKEDKDSKKG